MPRKLHTRSPPKSNSPHHSLHVHLQLEDSTPTHPLTILDPTKNKEKANNQPPNTLQPKLRSRRIHNFHFKPTRIPQLRHFTKPSPHKNSPDQHITPRSLGENLQRVVSTCSPSPPSFAFPPSPSLSFQLFPPPPHTASAQKPDAVRAHLSNYPIPC